jgi:hypothetical protein
MAWVKVIKLEKEDKSRCRAYFKNEFGVISYVVVTPKVLKFLKLKSFDNVVEMYVISSFLDNNSQIEFVRKVREREKQNE